MKLAIPKEIKPHEYRVGLSPATVREIVAHGHTVLVEAEAGCGIGFTDDDYLAAGARISAEVEELFDKADLVIKVKEPQQSECAMLRPGKTIFSYLHLAADPVQAERLLASGATAIAYETVTDERGQLPLLKPMSEVAGRMSIQVGAYHLQKAQGGLGVLLGGVPGVMPGKVMILGGGTAGAEAARMAVGLQADVTVLDRSVLRLQQLDELFQGRIRTLYATRDAIERHLPDADLVVGAALVAGATAPKLVSRNMVAKMKTGSVVVDISIDQGGCFDTSHPTTHQNPTFVEEGVVHYCVTNMPGAVARTSCEALVQVTLPYVLELADLGVEESLQRNPHLANGLNIHRGQVVHPVVAKSLGLFVATSV